MNAIGVAIIVIAFLGVASLSFAAGLTVANYYLLEAKPKEAVDKHRQFVFSDKFVQRFNQTGHATERIR